MEKEIIGIMSARTIGRIVLIITTMEDKRHE